jgi:hypothetical protein
MTKKFIFYSPCHWDVSKKKEICTIQGIKIFQKSTQIIPQHSGCCVEVEVWLSWMAGGRAGARDDDGHKNNWNDTIGLMVKYLLTLYLKEEVTDENNKTVAVMRIER